MTRSRPFSGCEYLLGIYGSGKTAGRWRESKVMVRKDEPLRLIGDKRLGQKAQKVAHFDG
jgi:hypothetical protein